MCGRDAKNLYFIISIILKCDKIIIYLYCTREKNLNLKIRPQVGSMTPASSASSRRRSGRV